MRRLALAVMAISFSLGCLAELKIKSPPQICTLLNDTQLRTGEWAVHADGQEGCVGAARPASSGTSDPNRISYSANGTQGVPSRVQLLLSVNVPSDEEAAKRELVKAAKRLSIRTLGLSTPPSIVESIMKGRPAELEVGSGSITVSRQTNNKQNYVLTVSIE